VDPRLYTVFSDRIKPFKPELRDHLIIMRDALIETIGAADMANNAVTMIRNTVNSSEIKFLASITASTGPFTSAAGNPYWLYEWSEVTWNSATSGFVSPSGPMTHTAFSDALNIFEPNTASTAGNTSSVVGTVIARLAIPNGWVVEMNVDDTGFVYFARENPVSVTCP
jgi:hypothetical protein